MSHTSSSKDPIYRLDDGSIITGTLVWYSAICKREVWLMAKNITPDEEDPLLDRGRAIHETSYKQFRKELQLEGMKIDLIKYKDKVICEVKTSSKFIKAARLQLLYYLYRLSSDGLEVEGEILIPLEKKKMKVRLDEEGKNELNSALMDIRSILSSDKPPLPNFIPYCKSCAYRYFCWSD